MSVQEPQNNERVEILRNENLLLDLGSRDTDSGVLLGVDDALLEREEGKMKREREERWKEREQGQVSFLFPSSIAREPDVRLTRLKMVGVDGKDLLQPVSVQIERDEGKERRDDGRRRRGSWDGRFARHFLLLPSIRPSPSRSNANFVSKQLGGRSQESIPKPTLEKSRDKVG